MNLCLHSHLILLIKLYKKVKSTGITLANWKVWLVFAVTELENSSGLLWRKLRKLVKKITIGQNRIFCLMRDRSMWHCGHLHHKNGMMKGCPFTYMFLLKVFSWEIWLYGILYLCMYVSSIITFRCIQLMAGTFLKPIEISYFCVILGRP